MPFFEVSQIVKSFGGLTAINRLSFHVEEGEILSLIGPNGAGKTTIFNLITGFYQPDAGQMRFQGDNIVGLTPDRVTRRGIARTFQNVRLFQNMSILETVMVGQHAQAKTTVLGTMLRTPGYKREEARVRQYAWQQLAFFGKRLGGYRMEQPAMALSYANRRRLEMARAMATGAKLLLLDEPAAGMNPYETLEITDVIRRLRDERNFTIVVIEHDMNVVKGISDRVVAMDYGRKIAEGTYLNVANNEQVIAAYLGRGAEDGEGVAQ